FYVAWTEDRLNDATPRVSIWRVGASLAPAPSWPPGGLLVCDAAGGQDQASLVLSGGDLLAAWRDRRGVSAEPPTDADIYIAKVAPDAVVGTLCSLVGVQAGPGGVRVRWRSDDGPTSAVVLRSPDGVEWSQLGTVLKDGRGIYDFVDGTVPPGSRWAYRMVTS